MPEHSPTKLAVVVRDDLATWQKLNVTAFLVSGIGTRHPDLIGEPYVDGDDVAYLPMFAHPVLVYGRRRRRPGPGRGPGAGSGPDDGDLHRRPVRHRQRPRQPGGGAARPHREARLAGVAMAGARREVDKALDKLRLHT